MPQLKAFGRNWFFASDDLPFYAVWGAFFHAAWALVLVLTALIERPESCKTNEAVNIFLFGLIASFLASVLVDVLFVHVGLKGTMFESGKRYASPIMLYFQAANFIVKIGFTAYGTHVVFVEPSSCIKEHGTFQSATKGVLISTWGIIGIFILFGIATYNMGSTTDSLATWEMRVRCLNCFCCGGLGSDQENLAQAAWVFADFFRPVDFTPVDTITAMVLAANRQRFQRMTRTLGRGRAGRRTWLSLARSAENSANPSVATQILENEAQTSSPEGPSPGFAPVVSEHTLFSSVDVGTEPNVSTDPREGSIEIVVESHKDDENDDESVKAVSDPGSVQKTDNATSKRRQRNLAVDMSAFDFSNGTDKMPDQPFSTVYGGQSDQQSRSSGGPSPKSLSQDTTEKRDGDHEISHRILEVEEYNEPAESPESPRLTTADILNEAEPQLSSGSSAQTTLTWGESFTGPFLTPPGGDRSLGVNSGEVPLEVLQKLLKYHRYSNAVYGALLYVVSGGSIGSCPRRCCSICVRATPPNIIRRNVRFMRTKTRVPRVLLQDASLIHRLDNEAILEWGVREEDIIHRSYANTIAGHLPYFIALDREDRAVVVAIRGTSSWTDLVTDFLIHPEPLNSLELQEIEGLLQEVRGGPLRESIPEMNKVSVHKGILGAARALGKDLEDCGFLKLLETRSHEKFFLEEDVSGWQLILTGHSLGAGVAALTSLLLRKRFVDLHCYAVSPPGGMMSPELANAMAPFCTSLVHGKDMIARLGVGPTERLRDQMVLSAAQCRKNKMQILAGAFLNKKWTEDELFCEASCVRGEALAAYQVYKSRTDRPSHNDKLCWARKFVAPGKIVFLRPVKEQGEKTTKRLFQAVWTNGVEIAKEGILMSAHMFTDHFPFLSIDSLESVIKARGSGNEETSAV